MRFGSRLKQVKQFHQLAQFQQKRHSSYPTSIRPTQQEIQNKRLTPQNLEVAIRSLHHDGLVVVEGAIPHEALNRLNAKMVDDARALQSREDSPFNYNPGNIQQDAPPVRAYFNSSIFLSNPTLY